MLLIHIAKGYAASLNKRFFNLITDKILATYFFA